MAALCLSAAAVRPMAPVAQSAVVAKASKAVFVHNAKQSTAFKVWTPNNKFFETFSFLPPLTGEQISKQVDYFVTNGWTPCLEFSDASMAYVGSDSCNRMAGVTSGYQDNRYWTMWKLPMFGCQDGGAVLKEIDSCTKAFPNAYIRLVAFDNIRQMQISGFLVHRPAGAGEFRAPSERSV